MELPALGVGQTPLAFCLMIASVLRLLSCHVGHINAGVFLRSVLLAVTDALLLALYL